VFEAQQIHFEELCSVFRSGLGCKTGSLIHRRNGCVGERYSFVIHSETRAG
jgi:hypothetical protein